MSDRLKRLQLAGKSFVAELENIEKNTGRLDWDEINQLAQTIAEDLIEEGFSKHATFQFLMQVVTEGDLHEEEQCTHENAAAETRTKAMR
jgi:hypothetical protein